MSKNKLLQTISFQNLQNWSVKYLLENKFLYNDSFDLVKIGSLLSLSRESILLDDDTEYKRVTIKLNNGGVFLRDKALGKNIGTKKQFIVKEGQFLLSKIDARNGAFGLATNEVDNAIVTNDFPIFNIKETVINARFLVLITTTKHFIKFVKSCSSGTTNRQRIDIKQFLEQKIPLPPIKVQKQIVQAYEDKINLANQLEQRAEKLEVKIEKYLYAKLGIEQAQEQKQDKKNLLRFVRFGKVSQWDFSTIFNKNINCKKYSVFTTIQKADLFDEIFRGKSPKYSNNDKTIILNQKCNRWNEINLEYAKTVKSEWLSKVDKKFFTVEGDVLINSTGDGTIGRASYIYDYNQKLLYDSHILLLRPNKQLVNGNYLAFFINSQLGQNQIEKIKSANSTKQTELGINNFKKIEIPLPPLEIQNHIAMRIQKLKDYIKALKQQAEQNREDALKNFEAEIFSKE